MTPPADREQILRDFRRRRAQAFLRELRLPDDVADEQLGYAAAVPAVQALRAKPLELGAQMTVIVGENGSGKSTLIEALAVAWGINPEGGTRNLNMSTRHSHSPLGEHLTLVTGASRPKTEFFLRAESVFTVATRLDEMMTEPFGGATLDSYGGKSLHEQSHGQSFLAIALNRFGPEGLYLLDEPESALSPQNQLTLMRRIHELTAEQSQFVVSTHSPLLAAYPAAKIILCDEHGLHEIDYEDVPAVRLTRSFLADPQRFVELALDEG